MFLQLVRSMPGSVDKEGICHCVVHLPNNFILLQQLEQLQSKVQEITSKYELSKVSSRDDQALFIVGLARWILQT